MDSEYPPPFPRDGEHAVFQRLIAPFFWGLLVNHFFWGVQITQSYYYYKSYRKTDSMWLKSAVAVLFITDLVESICISHACWTFLVDGWGDQPKVTLFPGLQREYILQVGILRDTSHGLFRRFYRTLLLCSKDLGIVRRSVSLYLHCKCNCPFMYSVDRSSIYMYATRITLDEFLHFKTWSCVWLVTASVTDIVIAIIMARKLSTSRIGFKKTDDMISRLIYLTVETGFATAIVQIVDLVIYLVWPLKTYHVVPALIAPKVYSNSMLALLNSRKPKTTPTWGTTQSEYLSQVQVGSISFRTPEEHQSQLSVPDDCEPEDVLLAHNGKLRSHNDQCNTTVTESCVSSSSKQL